MTRAEAESRIAVLREKIEYNSRLYYECDAPEIFRPLRTLIAPAALSG